MAGNAEIWPRPNKGCLPRAGFTRIVGQLFPKSPVKRRLDGVADLGAKAKLFEFDAQPVPQWAFRAQLVDQRFGICERVFAELGPGEQLTPGSRYFLFSQQCGGPFVRPEGIFVYLTF